MAMKARRIAHKKIRKRYDISKPQGVRGRNSDNSRLRQVLNWEPSISLEAGLEKTYEWIASQLSGVAIGSSTTPKLGL
jgi:GDP-D-mannose 3',5'-epimerase